MPPVYRAIVVALLATAAQSAVTAAESKADRIAVLIEALEDADLRYGASRELTRFGEKAVPALRRTLVYGAGDVRLWAAYTLGQIGASALPAVGDLIEAMGDSDDALRSAAASALGRIGPPAVAAVKPLAKALIDSRPAIRTNAAVALGRLGPSARAAAPQLIASLSDANLRKPARDALVQIGTAATVPLVKSLADERVRFDAAIVLIEIDPQAAKRAKVDRVAPADLPLLRTVLDDATRDAADRTRAAAGLASLGKAGIPALIAAFQNEQIAGTAAAAFARTGTVAVPDLIVALKHNLPQVRSTAADALAHIGPAAHRAVPHLARLLTDTDRHVRYRAVRALHTFGKAAAPAVPALIEIIKNDRESEPTRQWAIKTLIVTLPDTHDVVVKALIAASKRKGNYGVSQLARQEVRRIDLKAAEAAGLR